jgi:hypothetical protein
LEQSPQPQAGQGIFRQEAVQRLSSPEELDRLFRLTPPAAWTVLAGLWLVMVALVVWCFEGRIPVELSGQGILMRLGALQRVVAAEAGLITVVMARPGQKVEAHQPLLRLQPLSGGPSRVIEAGTSGTVAEIPLDVESYVEVGDTLARIEHPDRRLRALFYVPLAQGKLLGPGLPARISPATAESAAYGYLEGRVIYVSELPVSRRAISQMVESDSLADEFTRQGPVLEVLVDLLPDPGTPSGWKWSSGAGPDQRLTDGTPCQAYFVLRQERPVDLLLPRAAP